MTNMMKSIAVVVAATFTATTLQAQSAQEACPQWGEAAEQIMGTRLAGVPMSEMMGITEGNAQYESLIFRAFESPRFETESRKRIAMEDFRAEVELECYKSYRD